MIIETAKERRLFWVDLSNKWKVLHWAVGITGLTMSALAAAGGVSGPASPYFSLIATVCFGIIGFANPDKQAFKYISAYQILDHAVLLHELDKIDDEDLAEAIYRAEKIANPVNPATNPKRYPQHSKV